MMKLLIVLFAVMYMTGCDQKCDLSAGTFDEKGELKQCKEEKHVIYGSYRSETD